MWRLCRCSRLGHEETPRVDRSTLRFRHAIARCRPDRGPHGIPKSARRRTVPGRDSRRPLRRRGDAEPTRPAIQRRHRRSTTGDQARDPIDARPTPREARPTPAGPYSERTLSLNRSACAGSSSPRDSQSCRAAEVPYRVLLDARGRRIAARALSAMSAQAVETLIRPHRTA